MDPSDLKSRLAALTPEKRVVFLLSCAERMYPNYLEFQRRHRWGRPEVIRQALDLVWASLEGSNVNDQIQAVQRHCDEAMPDTEDFDTIYVSSALDAAVIASILLDLLQREDVGRALEGVSLALDTVDMFVQELEDMDPNERDLENRILQHPLMQRELQRQHDDLRLLEAIDALRTADILDLKRRWRAPARSSIDLTG